LDKKYLNLFFKDRPNNPFDLRSGTFDADQFFGTSQMQNYNPPTYIPPTKRNRQSPEAPPIERFY